MSELHMHDTIKTNGHVSGDEPATIRGMLETWMMEAIARTGDDEGEAIRLFNDMMRRHNKGFDVALRWLHALRAQHYLFASVRSKRQQKEESQTRKNQTEEPRPNLNQTAAPAPGQQSGPNGNGTPLRPPNVTSENHVAANKLWVQSYLDSVMVNGRAVGDCMVEEVRESCERRERDACFLRLLITGVPEGTGKPVRYFHSDPNEISRLYRIAELRSGTAATA